MLKKPIKCKDYNGVEREEVYWFNLSKAEIAEIELTTTGGLAEMIQNIVAAKDTPAIIKVFKDLILRAYGEKSPDGRYFLKLDDNGRPLSTKFAQTEAYSVLFMELATNTEAAIEFFNGIFPEELKKHASKDANTVDMTA